ncbi:isoprenylcysteine carboxylmethyltransferase family protein [Candidatus Uhrbacteria bacterium]|nr:isoprenylcysteine carboxylmethyltransferase family protein [Candidatus Uhrbacteria bacterium]
MIFLDLFAIVFFILLAPIPILSGIFQYNPKWFRRFGNWNYVGVVNFYFVTAIVTLNYLYIIIMLRYPLTQPLVIAGGVILVIGCIISYIAGRTLTLKTLISLPQIHPERYRQQLVTNGLYKIMRHPRYIGYWMMALGFAMTTGLLLMWLFFIWLIVGLAALALLEERELRQRFGKEYADYMRRVPAFIPKFF